VPSFVQAGSHVGGPTGAKLGTGFSAFLGHLAGPAMANSRKALCVGAVQREVARMYVEPVAKLLFVERLRSAPPRR
jgi:hypothetical protein